MKMLKHLPKKHFVIVSMALATVFTAQSQAGVSVASIDSGVFDQGSNILNGEGNMSFDAYLSPDSRSDVRAKLNQNRTTFDRTIYEKRLETSNPGSFSTNVDVSRSTYYSEVRVVPGNSRYGTASLTIRD